MAKGAKGSRLSKAAKEFNVGISTIVEFLNKKGLDIDSNPNNKVPAEYYDLLVKEYSSDSEIKKESDKLSRTASVKKETITLEQPEVEEEEYEEDDVDEAAEDVVEKEEVVKEEEVVEEVVAEEEPAAPEIVEEIVEEVPEPVVEEVVEEVVAEKVEETVLEVPKVTEEPVAEPVVEETVEEPVVEKEETPEEVVAEPVKEEKKPESKEEVAAEEVVETTIEEEVKETVSEETVEEDQDGNLKVIGKIDLNTINQKTRPGKKSKKEKEEEKIKKDQEKAEAKENWKKKLTPEEEAKKKTTEKSKAKQEPVVEKPAPEKAKEEVKPIQKEEPKEEIYKAKREVLTGPTVVGKIVLPVEEKKKKKPVASSSDADKNKNKKRRKRIKNERVDVDKKKEQVQQKGKKPQPGKPKKRILKTEVSEVDVQKQIKDTLARLTNKGKSKTSKYRRNKREDVRQKAQDDHAKEELEKNVIKVSEFVSVSELSAMMNIEVTQIISACMGLGLLVSINQRLDAETLTLVADEFGYTVEFISVDIQSEIIDEEEDEANLVPRSPIVTVMGHVDHGKTSLLDYIRSANVISGEAGGITQHIGAYGVTLPSGKKITFLDTPGHEAFTAMRARGASVTDIVIIVVSADDDIMPQTVEAINHASAAGVPIVFAINKIDKPGANPEKIKEGLANMNYLVEDWGGKYQSQEISAKHGTNIEELLEKVLLESELLELKGNPNRNATGSIIESSLDKGRGYVATMLVQTGTLKVSDIILAGSYTGHVKAMYNEAGKKVKEVGPSMPALILGLNGAPQAGDKFNVMNSEREAREIANKRDQLLREQGLRTQKHITLDEIGRRLALGDFHEINVIVKGDVDGSIEALSDSLIKLSTESVQVNIIHKAVGAISESDILLATASNAVVVGFQVRPSLGARQLAEKEQIDIRLYSIIYDAINEMKDAMEGMLSPDTKEEIVATLEVRETFRITKVGTIAGCIVKGGKITRNTKIRIIREGIVVYTGELGSLKRFKDDVKEVANGYECGLNVEKYNDIKVGDIIEGYKTVEVKRTL